MRPIILGMNNPHSSDPLLVLSPTGDPGSAGNRLWNMSGMSETEYRLAFDRRNLVSGPEWTSEIARLATKRFVVDLEEIATIVVLGRLTWNAFAFLPGDQWPCRAWRTNARTWWFVPHPSGRNLWYNDPENGRKVGKLLRRLAG